MKRASSSRRGFTLVELTMGVAVAALLALTVSSLFKAGILTARYSLGQTQVLSSARSALMGAGGVKGIVWETQEASSFSTMSSSSLALGYSAGPTHSFRLAGRNLLQNELGSDRTIAAGVSSVTFGYYNLDSAGRVMQSTAAESAAMVTAEIVLPGDRGKTFSFLTGARLRNKP